MKVPDMSILHSGHSGSSIPADAYMAQGVLGQLIVVVPSKDLVIVRVANQRKHRIDMAKLITMVIDAESDSKEVAGLR